MKSAEIQILKRQLWARTSILVQPFLVELIGVEFPDETYQSQHYWIPYKSLSFQLPEIILLLIGWTYRIIGILVYYNK